MNRRIKDAIEQQGVRHTTKVYQQANAMIYQVCPRYQAIIRAFLKEVNQLLQGFSEFERVSLIYQMIADEVTYDESKKRSLSHTFLGALKDGVGVCEGISELFFLLCNSCTTCKAYLICGTTEEWGEDSLHQWNVLKFSEGDLAGKLYHSDVTWDLGKEQPNWFLRDDKIGRTWNRKCYPAATEPFEGRIYRNDRKLHELRECLKKTRAKF